MIIPVLKVKYGTLTAFHCLTYTGPQLEKAHLIKSQSNFKTLRTSRHLWDKVQSLPSHPCPQSTFHPHYPSPSSKPFSQQPLKITCIFLANYTVFNSSESFFLCLPEMPSLPLLTHLNCFILPRINPSLILVYTIKIQLRNHFLYKVFTEYGGP